MAALALYARTLPPGLAWAHNGADGGDLLAAALTGGVPHPTGYPTYQLLLRFTLSFYPGEPARGGAWLSAICAVAAVALLTDLARRVTLTRAQMPPQLAAVAGLAAGLAWAVSPLLWGQATIVEVYALNALFCVALLWLVWRWAEAPATRLTGPPWLTISGALLGLGLGNHLTLALTVPGILFFIWKRGHLKVGFRREVGLAAAASLAGLLVYVYLPLAAAQRAPINWGDPITLDRFLWVVTGRLYNTMPLGLPLAELPARLSGWTMLLMTALTPLGFFGALFGLYQLDRRLRDWWAATLIIWLTATVYAVGYNSTDSDAYLIPAFAIMALWLAEGLGAVLAEVTKLLPARILRFGIAGASALAIIALAAVPAIWNWNDHDLRHDGHARGVVSAVSDAAPNAVILTAGDRETFTLWYSVYGLRQRSDVAVVNVNLYGFEWYRRSLADTHPNLLPSVDAAPPLDSLIERWLAERPVYVTEDVGLPLRTGERILPSAILMPVLGLSD